MCLHPVRSTPSMNGKLEHITVLYSTPTDCPLPLCLRVRCIMRYLGKSHNLWYRMSLSLEQLAMDSGSLQMIRPKKEAADLYDFEPSANSKEVGVMAGRGYMSGGGGGLRTRGWRWGYRDDTGEWN